jgi:small subunit ribosomal protein S2
VGASSGQVLFVGTKKQAQIPIEEEAQRCGMPYVTTRWLGGTLTNFSTIKARVNRLKELLQLDQADGAGGQLTQGKKKKEILRLSRERERLAKYFKGILEMERLPKAIFVVDPIKEAIAVREAKKLHIPVIAIVDTNCDPEGLDFVLPGNDDAIRAIRLFSSSIADAVLEGNAMRKDELDLEEAMVTAAKTAESETNAGNDDSSADSRKAETLLDDSESEAPTSTAPAAVDPSTEESAESGKKIEG